LGFSRSRARRAGARLKVSLAHSVLYR
jgi:hypothetical protein